MASIRLCISRWPQTPNVAQHGRLPATKEKLTAWEARTRFRQAVSTQWRLERAPVRRFTAQEGCRGSSICFAKRVSSGSVSWYSRASSVFRRRSRAYCATALSCSEQRIRPTGGFRAGARLSQEPWSAPTPKRRCPSGQGGTGDELAAAESHRVIARRRRARRPHRCLWRLQHTGGHLCRYR